MNVRLNDTSSNVIFPRENIKTDKPVVLPTFEPKLNYKSQTDFSKLLVDPKLNEKKIDFSLEKAIENEKITPETTEDSKGLVGETISTVKDKNTLALVGCVLSAVKIPQAEPLKVTVNLLKAGNKKNSLADDIEHDNYEGIVTNSVDLAKNSWGSAVGLAKITEWSTDAIADIGIISKTGRVATKVGKMSTTVSSVASKVAVPFSILGTAISAIDVKNSNSLVQSKKQQINRLNIAVSTSKNPNSAKAKQAKELLNNQLSTLKTNRSLKTVSLGLSAVSSATLVASIKSPSNARVYATVSLVTSIASSVTSVVADDNVRSKLSDLASNIRSKF